MTTYISNDKLPAFLAVTGVLTLAACGAYPSILDVIPRDPDVAPPEIELATPAGRLEVGRALKAGLTDDQALGAAVAILLDTAGTPVWISDTVSLNGTKQLVEFTIDDLGADFPWAAPLSYTVWARDSTGNARYAGTSDDAPLDIGAATKFAVTVLQGRSFDLPAGGSIGGLVYDPPRRQYYFTDNANNRVGLFRLDTPGFAPWTVRVGSRPDLITLQPYAWGVGPVLAVMNSGGTDISIVDLYENGSGGHERWRLPIPLVRVEVAGVSMPLEPSANSLLIHCADDFCNDPVLFIGSPAVGSTNAAVLRSISIRDPNPLAKFDILTPDYRPELEADESIVVRAFEVTAHGESLLLDRDGISKCGTLVFGRTASATTEAAGGPFFIAEQGQAEGACGDGGRVLRFDRDAGGGYHVAAETLIHHTFDGGLRGVREVAANADASLLALRTDGRIIITTSELRRIGTIEAEGARAVAFLEGQSGAVAFGGPRHLVAVATANGVSVYETGHFDQLLEIETAGTFGGTIHFVRLADGGAAIVGPSEDRTALLFVEIPIEEF